MVNLLAPFQAPDWMLSEEWPWHCTLQAHTCMSGAYHSIYLHVLLRAPATEVQEKGVLCRWGTDRRQGRAGQPGTRRATPSGEGLRQDLFNPL